MGKVQCFSCGNVIEKEDWRIRRTPRHFCDRTCFAAYQRSAKNTQSRKTVKACAVCGALVERSPSRFKDGKPCYCSSSCANVAQKGLRGAAHFNWRGGKERRVCCQCKKEFFHQRTRTRTNRGLFCSKLCMIEAGRAEKPCANCGTTVTSNLYRMRQWNNVFCNKGCYSEWQSRNQIGKGRKRISVRCEWCGEELETIPCLEGRKKFCNRECRGKWHSQNFRGARHPNWRGGTPDYYGDNWTEQRRKALKRDNHQCQRCKRYQGQDGIRLNVHHIKKFRLFGYVQGVNENYKQANQLSNLVTLCVSCHSTVEPRFLLE